MSQRLPQTVELPDEPLAGSSWKKTVRLLTRQFPWVVAGTALGLLMFGRTAFLMSTGDSNGFDQRVLLAMRTAGDLTDPIGPLWLAGFMRDVTGLGGFGVLSFIVLAVTAFLAATQRRREALEIFAMSFSGWLLSHAMKFVFQRPRPDLVPYGADVFSSSFPSGHATVSAVVYLTLAAVLARSTDDVRVKAFVVSLAILLTVAIGFSRVYLGVHWPTDVLAGWSLGAAWVGLCISVVRHLERSQA